MEESQTLEMFSLGYGHFSRLHKLLPNRVKLILASVPPQHDFTSQVILTHITRSQNPHTHQQGQFIFSIHSILKTFHVWEYSHRDLYL